MTEGNATQGGFHKGFAVWASVWAPLFRSRRTLVEELHRQLAIARVGAAVTAENSVFEHVAATSPRAGAARPAELSESDCNKWILATRFIAGWHFFWSVLVPSAWLAYSISFLCMAPGHAGKGNLPLDVGSVVLLLPVVMYFSFLIGVLLAIPLARICNRMLGFSSVKTDASEQHPSG